MIVRFSAFLSLLLLTGCLSIGGEKTELAVYAPLPAIKPDTDWPSVDWSLAIAEPQSSTALDSPGIGVRPRPGQLQVYAGAVWSDSAPALLHQAMVQAFDDSGRFAAIASTTQGISTDRRLELEIRQFEAIYADRKTPPNVVIAVRAMLVDVRSQRMLATRSLKVSLPAQGTSLPEVVPVFEQALGQLAGELIGWSLEIRGAGRHPAADH